MKYLKECPCYLRRHSVKTGIPIGQHRNEIDFAQVVTRVDLEKKVVRLDLGNSVLASQSKTIKV